MLDRKTSNKSCQRKVPYKNRASALKAKRALKIRYGGKYQSDLHPYLCNVCNKWHLGHKTNDVNKLIDKLGEKDGKRQSIT